MFPLYMTIQNLVKGDPEYGKYFWLGLPLYDDRVPMSPLYINGDQGTGSLIYSPAFSNFVNISVHSKRIVHVTGDMMPFARLGLQEAIKRGFFKSTDLSKYYVGGMNIGWEVTGLNNGTIEIGNFKGWKRVTDLNQYTNGPLNGKWILSPVGTDPQLLSPVIMIDTTVVKKIIIKMSNDHLPDDSFQLFWSTDATGSFNENNSIWIQVINDGGWREYILDFSNNSKWINIVRRLRIDPVRKGDGAGFGIDYIRFAAN
ncbi:unnamed protein product [Adineta steineri]|uniref:Uncharacterized protein n=1 Tax=Adineta steineri TaxID=433720 RepID=A0A815IM21_9BILA|nr:unnamed protein product [Adineta steineri]